MKTWIMKSTVLLLYILLSTLSFAQIPDKVGSLIAVDKNTARIASEKTPFEAFMSVIDKPNSTLFVPSQVNAYDYLSNRPNFPDVMSWEPTLALVSRSMEWGVTTGPMSFQKVGARKRFGEYLTVWKRDRKGKWKIDIHAQVEHYENKGELPALSFFEPNDSWYMKQKSKQRLQQREEVVFETDKVMATILKAANEIGYTEFLDDDVKFLFPWQNPIEGKKNVLAFLKKTSIRIETTPEKVDRTYSGEYAYSIGTANVFYPDKVVKYNYIRVWKLTNDFQWKVLIEMMFER